MVVATTGVSCFTLHAFSLSEHDLEHALSGAMCPNVPLCIVVVIPGA